MPDLSELIKGMSPGALGIFKKQIASLPEAERQRAFSRLSGIPELSDIIGRKTPEALITTRPRQPQVAQPLQPQGQQQVRMPWEVPEDLPWWQKGLAYFGMPFNVVSKMFASAVTSPWTPATPETRAMPWWKKELTEYEQTKLPWGVKFWTEMAPWLAIPGIGTATGAGRGIAGGLAKVAPRLGRAAPLVRGGAKALEWSPWGMTEKATGMAFRPVGKILSKAIGKTAKPVPSKIWAKLTKTERSALAKELGIPEKVGQRAWSRLGKKNQATITDTILHPEKTVTRGVVKPEKVVAPKITSKLFPEGFDTATESSIKKLNELTKATKLRTKATELLRKPERAARIGKFKELRDKFVREGLDEEHALNAAKKALEKEYPKAELDIAESLIRKGLEPEDFQRLLKLTREAPYSGKQAGWIELNTSQALQKLFDGQLLQRNEIILLERIFGSDLAKTLLSKRTWGKKVGEAFVEIANAPRAMLASCDISGLLRQGAILFTRHPIEGLKTVRPMLKAMLSDKRAELMDDIIRSRAGMDELLDPKLAEQLDLTALPSKVSSRFIEREEPFMGQAIERIPIIGPLIKGSNRAYVTVLNDMRSRSALKALNSWKKAKMKFSSRANYSSTNRLIYGRGDISDLNRLVNWASGR